MGQVQAATTKIIIRGSTKKNKNDHPKNYLA
jgi:hypothetical protein